MRHSSQCLGLMCAGMLALAGCGGSASVAAPASPASVSAAPKASQPAAPSASAVASAKPAASAKPSAASAAPAAASSAGGPIQVGSVNPLTGSLAELGKEANEGFNLYLDSVNSTMAGRKIQVQQVDSQGEADVALNKAKQLVESNHVQVLMGVVNTAVCYALAGYVKQAQVPLMVSSDCGAEGLFVNAQFQSPYVTRFSQTSSTQMDPAAAWAYDNGHRKAILFAADYQAGIEYSDLWASAFVGRGGTVVQEIHPPLSTTDFGTYLAELDKSADVMAWFIPGAGALSFGNQYQNYVGHSKLQILDVAGQLSSGPPLGQLKDKDLGVVADSVYSEAAESPTNTALMKAFQAKYPGQVISKEVANGYAAGQALDAALQKVHGNIEDKQAFLQALYGTNISSAKGPLKLGSNHDVIENSYIFQIEKGGTLGVQPKVIKTYTDVSEFWDRTEQQVQKFNYGKMKGQWVGMTKAKLGDVLTLPPQSS